MVQLIYIQQHSQNSIKGKTGRELNMTTEGVTPEHGMC